MVIHTSVTSMDQKENGNAINYRNRTLQSFSSYNDALSFARREQKNLRAPKKVGDSNYDSLHVSRKMVGGHQSMRYLTRDSEGPPTYKLE